MADEARPAKPWRLSQKDREFLKNLRIAPSEEPDPDVCPDCHGSGMATALMLCPTCRGRGSLET